MIVNLSSATIGTRRNKIISVNLDFYIWLNHQSGVRSRKAFSDENRKALMLGKIEGRRRRGQQRMRGLDGITDSMDRSLFSIN